VVAGPGVARTKRAAAAAGRIAAAAEAFEHQSRTRGGTEVLMLRHEISAEELGVIAPVTRSPDEICASVSEDPAVVEAVQRWDRATPSTWRDLVSARLAAPARVAVREADRAPICSGDVEGYLITRLPIIEARGQSL
jgi:hypothetical protein